MFKYATVFVTVFCHFFISVYVWETTKRKNPGWIGLDSEAPPDSALTWSTATTDPDLSRASASPHSAAALVLSLSAQSSTTILLHFRFQILDVIFIWI